MAGAKKTKVAAPPVIGQTLGGGYYAGKIKDGTAEYYLIAAPKETGETEKKWAELSTGVKSKTDGLANTAALVNGSALTHPAAQFCDEFAIDGYDDWYLPSKDELAVLYAAKAAFATAGQAFVDVNYWSSTEYDANYAWYQYFANGTQYYIYKYFGFYVRAVRRLKI